MALQDTLRHRVPEAAEEVVEPGVDLPKGASPEVAASDLKKDK